MSKCRSVERALTNDYLAESSLVSLYEIDLAEDSLPEMEPPRNPLRSTTLTDPHVQWCGGAPEQSGPYPDWIVICVPAYNLQARLRRAVTVA